MRILEVALVGCGEISQHHLGAILQLPDQIKVTATIDPVRERDPPL